MAQTNPFETAFTDAAKIGEAIFNPVKTIDTLKSGKQQSLVQKTGFETTFTGVSEVG
jgi:hypothetical protein